MSRQSGSICSASPNSRSGGTRRDHIRAGLRTTGYRRRMTIAFLVAESDVIILAVLYAGRDVDTLMREDDTA